MGKFILLTIMMVMILAAFHVFGVVDDTPLSSFVSVLLNPRLLIGGDFWLAVQFVFTLATVGGLMAGMFLPTKFDFVFLISMASFLLGAILPDSIKIYQFVAAQSSLMGLFAIFFIAPLYLIWLFALLDWWRGRD